MTYLDRTDRQKTNEVPLNDPRNNPTWSQHYVGVWQRLKGEPLPVNTSRSRYVVPVIGAVSNDGKYMIALACDSPRYSAQAWHTCLHHVVNWGPEKCRARTAVANEAVRRGERTTGPHDADGQRFSGGHATEGARCRGPVKGDRIARCTT